jgi:hypothetical protein
MDKKINESRRIPKIVNDNLSLMLWGRCVSVEEENDLATMKSLLTELHRMPYAGSIHNPILNRMVKDGAGFDGLNAAMMTYGYLQHICLYFINKA